MLKWKLLPTDKSME